MFFAMGATYTKSQKKAYLVGGCERWSEAVRGMRDAPPSFFYAACCDFLSGD
jgi:hypothetical protein